MEISQITVPSFNAEITIGLNKGYTEEVWSMPELKMKLATAQQKLKEINGILLSTKMTLCDIVFLGQDEPSVTLSFINYPKFPLEKTPFKEGVLFIAKRLMNELKQNRIVIVFSDETVMLEKEIRIDPRIV